MPLSSTSFTPSSQPPVRRGKSPATIVKDAILAATGGDLQAYWAWVVEQSKKEDGAPYVKMVLDRVTPPLKAQMLTVHFDFPTNGTAVDQAQAVMAAVTQGVLPLDFAGPMLTMIQIIDTAKGGTLGNSGLDLSALYQGTDMSAATNFAKQIAALQPKANAIDITPTRQQEPKPITDALQHEADAIDADADNVTDLIEAAASRLASLYPSNTPTAIYNGIADLINARQQAKEAAK